MYRNGDFVDLCRGPHVPYSTMIQTFNSTRTSSTNWLGKASEREGERDKMESNSALVGICLCRQLCALVSRSMI